MDRRGGTRQEPGAIGPRVTVPDELLRHEELLRRGAPAARVAVVRERALSFGIGVPLQAPYLVRARARGIPTVARSSGGSGVLHLEGDLLWAVVLPRSDPEVGRDFPRAFGRLGQGVLEGLEAAGVRASWAAAPGLADDYCPLSSRGEVLLADGKVLGGAAQHVTSRALLHHGSVSWTVDRAEVDRVFGLPTPGPSSRLGGVTGSTGALGPEDVARSVARALAERDGR